MGQLVTVYHWGLGCLELIEDGLGGRLYIVLADRGSTERTIPRGRGIAGGPVCKQVLHAAPCASVSAPGRLRSSTALSGVSGLRGGMRVLRHGLRGRVARLQVDSLAAQEDSEWGAIVVDDASTNRFGEYAEVLLAPFADRVTLVQNETRRGTLHNTWKAVTGLCTNPETVIITLDADDALIGRHVLCRVRAEYADGADLTVGSMLRMDKDAHYPADFDNPRSWRSNVWQHLRTFRKYLFDAIDVNDLKLDGEWIDLANDWAFLVPMVEMASSPRHVQDKLYLYEPASPRSDQYRRRRDSIIERILAKPRYSRLVPQRHA